ncbi:hypothetical protein Tco_1102346 [Tanacetum coccineum]
MIQPEPEGSTQGYPLVSAEVLSHGPSDAKLNPPQPLKVSQQTLVSFLTEITHISINFLTPKHAEFDESNANVLERFYTSAGNPVKEILLKLNLSDHRILKMVVKYSSKELLEESGEADSDLLSDACSRHGPVELVPKVDDLSLVDGFFDGASSGDGEEDFVIGEGVMKRLEWNPWKYRGGEEKCGEDDEEHGEGSYFTRMNGIKEVKHESYRRRIQK